MTEKLRAGDVVVHEGEHVYEYQGYGSDTQIQLTLRLVRDYIAVPSKSGKKPEPGDCLHFIMMCKARGLNPWEGDCFMLGYDGKFGTKFSLITAHQAFLKRSELHPKFDGMESGVIVHVQDKPGKIEELPGDLVPPDYILVGGWARVHCKNRAHPTYRRLDVEKYDPGRPFTPWAKNPAMMIVKCAEADALRSTFPTKLGGLYLREEMARIDEGLPTKIAPPLSEGKMPVVIKAEEPKSKTESLSDRLKGGEQSTEDIHKVIEEVEGGAGKPKKPKTKKKSDVPGTWEKILMMTNGDEEQAQKALLNYMKRAGREIEDEATWDDLSKEDKNFIAAYVEEDFKAQSGEELQEPQMTLDE